MKRGLWLVMGFATGMVLSGIQVSAKSPEKTEVMTIFNYKTNLGMSKSSSLVVRDKEIIVDGMQLNAIQKSRAAPYLTRVLRTPPKKTDRACRSGSFTHIVHRQGKEFVEQGCLDSMAFAELNRSFEVLQLPGY